MSRFGLAPYVDSFDSDDSEMDDTAAKRHFVLLSGGPGPFDTRDVEHDASWANYVTPPLLMTDAAGEAANFSKRDEQIWWFIYKPAYEKRWNEDDAATDSRRQKEVRRVRDQGFSSYVDLLEARAKSRGWKLRWLERADDLWTKLGTFRARSVSRLWYWGHARDDLWLTIDHSSTGEAVEPSAEAVIKIADIDSALRPKFQKGSRHRMHRFIGCNTEAFAKAWSVAFRVWTEGVREKIDFRSIHATGGEPCLVTGASVHVFTSSGAPSAATAALTMNACGDIASESGGLAAEADESADIIARAERILHGNGAATSAALLHAVFADDLDSWPFDQVRAPYQLAFLFDALARPQQARVAAELHDRFVVVGPPNGLPLDRFRAGDVWLRRAPGEPALTHAGLLLSDELFASRDANGRGIQIERAPAGTYVQVLEAGSVPHCSHRPFARRVLDEHGMVPANQMIVRPYRPAAGTNGGFRASVEQTGLPDLSFTRVPADAHPPKGYDWSQVRSDFAASYGALYAKVRALGGRLTSSGGRRGLDAKVTAGRSSTSLHYLGRAIDLYVASGMHRANDPYIIVRDGGSDSNPLWHVYCASLDPRTDDVLFDPALLIDTEMECAIWQRGGYRTIRRKVRCFSLTNIALGLGWRRIPARSKWKTDYMSVEWWHFQNETGLVANVTLFGDELRRIYPESKVQQSGLALDAVWTGRGSFKSSPATVPRAPAPSATHGTGAEHVAWAQAMLNTIAGERLKGDGQMGPRTQAALRRFQQREHISITGELDAATDTALVQRALEAAAAASMFGAIGRVDDRTSFEIRRFQQEHGLAVSGVPDAALRAKLMSVLLSGRVLTAP